MVVASMKLDGFGWREVARWVGRPGYHVRVSASSAGKNRPRITIRYVGRDGKVRIQRISKTRKVKGGRREVSEVKLTRRERSLSGDGNVSGCT